MAGGHHAEELRFEKFDLASFPRGVKSRRQVEYLRCYLTDLGAKTVVEEPQYFDRDYLAEFSAFYATSSKGYSNACRRLHLFAIEEREVRRRVYEALAGDAVSLAALNEAYLGFSVIRPLEMAPLGRTVLRLYPETHPDYPRVTEPARPYVVHLAGLPLHVDGLAWQQQDQGVGACATVALWTMFHSSALDEHHAIPTTAAITRSANTRWPMTRRVFPSDGLHIQQVCDAIREHGLLPAVLDGDHRVELPGGALRGFSRSRFAASCAALIRSGYPVLIAAKLLKAPNDAGHAVTAVGFRPGPSPLAASGSAEEEDGGIVHLYIHDDNLGPSVRFGIEETGPGGIAVLRADPPPPLSRTPGMPNPTQNYFELVPTSIVGAVPDEIRVSADYLNRRALRLAGTVAKFFAARSKALPGVTFSAGFLRISQYISRELPQRLDGRRLVKARLALANRVPPMSLYVGVMRISLEGRPLFDALLDTSDSELAPQIFAHVLFQPISIDWLGDVGVGIAAF